MINILADSCSDLSQDLIDLHRIDIIHLSVFINERTYFDGLDIDTNGLFALVEKTGTLPKTSAPSVAEFVKFFDRPGDNIFLGIGSPLSATYSNAVIASQNLEGNPVRIIDSLNLSTGIGLLILKAADLVEEGCSVDVIESQIRLAIPKVHTAFVVDTLDYIYKGGRCSSIELIVGSLLKIRPIIEVRPDGTLGVREKSRGTRKKALDSLLADFRQHLAEVDLQRVFVTHTNCDEDAHYLETELKKIAPIRNLHITYAGSTIASHCGPGCIGILYMTI
jgi:DegV family protein with EDD domain